MGPLSESERKEFVRLLIKVLGRAAEQTAGTTQGTLRVSAAG
jgi:hypothetical protein